ncbi:MAG: 3-dehydroquinate dehydratase [Firmicutes bacterium]|nr:3-dehydroquinate dehydratase [Bacillota bacterium]
MSICKPCILVIHGPNLNLLGTREPNVYGAMTLADINQNLTKQAAEFGVEVDFIQTNHEGVMIDCIHQAAGKYSCIIINPAAFSHYSIAVRDALAAISVPAVEVHMSNIHAREKFRHRSVISPVVRGQIVGFGADSYFLALQYAVKLIAKEEATIE